MQSLDIIMRSTSETLLAQSIIAAYLLFVAAVCLWHEWKFRIQPLSVSQAEINRMADELLDLHGPRAEEVAFIEEDRAWRYSDTYQQGVWRRVRKELWRRGG